MAEFEPCRDLSEGDRLAAAELAADAMSELYDPIRADVVPVLAAEFLIAEGELGNAFVTVGPGVSGLLAHYPAEEMTDRQQASLHHALRSLSGATAGKLIAGLRGQSERMPRLRATGSYIARIAISKNLLGTGMADHLIAMFAKNRPVLSLHVRKDNFRAVTFYLRHGFTERDSSEDFLLMTRG